MDGIILRVKENGQIEEYKELYTTIECATEEDFKRLEYFLNLGKAIEKAYKDGYTIAQLEQIPDGKGYQILCHHAIGTIKGLLEYLESED